MNQSRDSIRQGGHDSEFPSARPRAGKKERHELNRPITAVAMLALLLAARGDDDKVSTSSPASTRPSPTASASGTPSLLIVAPATGATVKGNVVPGPSPTRSWGLFGVGRSTVYRAIQRDAVRHASRPAAPAASRASAP